MTTNTVLGGMGLIGSAIVNELLDRGNSVKILDLTGDQQACDEVFGEGRVQMVKCDVLHDPLEAHLECDNIYHMVGALGTSELEQAREKAVQLNIVAALRVFDKAIAAGAKNIFYPTKPNVWLNTYTITKVATESFVTLYNSEGKINICSLRYFNAYGPRQHLFPIRKIVPTFAVQAMKGLPIEVYGNGEQTVDMIYVDDMAKLTVNLTEAGYNDKALDCGRGVPLTVNQVAKDVNAYFNNKAGVKHVPMRVGETENTILTASLEGPLKEFQFSDWTPTLHETLAWYAGLPGDVINNTLKFYNFT